MTTLKLSADARRLLEFPIQECLESSQMETEPIRQALSVIDSQAARIRILANERSICPTCGEYLRMPSIAAIASLRLLLERAAEAIPSSPLLDDIHAALNYESRAVGS